jgi:uncharacterized membrane protein
VRAPDYFTEQQRQAIKSAIENAERITSGELRVFVDDHCHNMQAIDRAIIVFEKLNMHKTQLRHGVLIYLSVDDHKYAIIGDTGIHNKVGADFWNEAKEAMLFHFKMGDLTAGIIAGINKAGEALSIHFPRAHDDTDELQNDMVFGS